MVPSGMLALPSAELQSPRREPLGGSRALARLECLRESSSQGDPEKRACKVLQPPKRSGMLTRRAQPNVLTLCRGLLRVRSYCAYIF
jgi:hypothetical protein